MTAPRIPTPPATDSAWSVMTLAAFLGTTGAALYDALCPFIKANGYGEATFGATRTGHHFWLTSDDERSGVTVTDSYLSDAAVAHLVAQSATASWPPLRTEPLAVVIPLGSS